ncbi:MAG: DNA alkylation repair protein [Planctomycetota bacterium]
MAAAPTAASILAELKKLGSASYKKTMLVHGAREPVYGTKISDMKVIQKRVGGINHELALELWDSGCYDAMYLAGLMVDDSRMGKRDLQQWMNSAYCSGIAEYSVAWVAAGSPVGWEVATKWIDSKRELEAAAGWNALSGIVAMKPDSELDLDALRDLLGRVVETVHGSANRVKYTMNTFIAAVGTCVKPLAKQAMAAAKAIGVVEVDMHGTGCKVRSAAEQIERVAARGTIFKKRKMVKC